MKKIEAISIREFARRVETNERNVREAIRRGNIMEGYDKKAKKIIFEVAYKEWGIYFKERKLRKEMKQITTADLRTIENINIEEITLSVNDPALVLERKHNYIKASRDLLKLKTEAGELQNKEDVYRELFSFGKEVRLKLQSIPDRIIDQLITLNRNDAHKLLSETINESLQKIAESHVD
ncbi:MAG: hypothetical protein M9898_02135 [Chitinophagaceae bacterium]|nr:hypothetical protein [Chitinophagaceae bacterium]